MDSLIECCTKGDLEALKKMNLQFAEKVDLGFLHANRYNHINVVEYLLDFEFLNFEITISQALRIACLNGYFDLVKLLSKSNKGDVIVPLTIACQHDHLDIVKFLLPTANIDNPGLNMIFRCACENGSLRTAKFLLSFSNDSENDLAIKINGRENRAFKYSCFYGKLDVVKFLISKMEKSDLDQCMNIGFVYACEKGHLDVAEYLFSIEEQLDDLDEIYRTACKNGHLEIIKFLFSIGKDKITMSDDFAFTIACENNHIDIMDYLLSLEKIDVNKNNNYAFKVSCKNGNLDIVKMLLSNESHSKSEQLINKSIRLACKNNWLDIVECLFSVSEITDETKTDMLNSACEKGKLNMTQYLLSQNTQVDSYAFLLACKSGNLVLIKTLYEHAYFEIDLHYNKDEAYRSVCKKQFIFAEKYLKKLLNKNRFEYYCCINEICHIVKPIDFNDPEYGNSVIFDDFRIYCDEAKYVDDCIEEYRKHYGKFQFKSAYSNH